MQKIRKGDKVVILTGKDKGRSGEVLQVMPKEDRAVVRGINVVKRHQLALRGASAVPCSPISPGGLRSFTRKSQAMINVPTENTTSPGRRIHCQNRVWL